MVWEINTICCNTLFIFQVRARKAKRKGKTMLQKNFEGWRTFKGKDWKEKVNVSDFIQKNYTEYTGTADFLAQPTEKTKKIWKRCLRLFRTENEKGVLDIEIHAHFRH